MLAEQSYEKLFKTRLKPLPLFHPFFNFRLSTSVPVLGRTFEKNSAGVIL